MSYKDNVKNSGKLDFGTDSVVSVKDYKKYIKKSDHYLIWQTVNLDGDDTPVVWFVNDMSAIFGRDKKVKIRIDDVSSDGKVLKCIETINNSISYVSFIISLSFDEYNELYSYMQAGSINLYDAIDRYIDSF